MLSCNTVEQNIGTVIEGTLPEIRYVIENTSNETYEIKPWASCGCSTPLIPRSNIAPGEKITMVVIFDSMDKVGMNEKSVGVWYGDKQRLNLKFKAEVIKPKE